MLPSLMKGRKTSINATTWDGSGSETARWAFHFLYLASIRVRRFLIVIMLQWGTGGGFNSDDHTDSTTSVAVFARQLIFAERRFLGTFLSLFASHGACRIVTTPQIPSFSELKIDQAEIPCRFELWTTDFFSSSSIYRRWKSNFHRFRIFGSHCLF